MVDLFLFDDLEDQQPSNDDRPIQLIEDIQEQNDFIVYFQNANSLIESVFQLSEEKEYNDVSHKIINSYINSEYDLSFYAGLLNHFINFRPKQRNFLLNFYDNLSKYPLKSEEFLHYAKSKQLNLLTSSGNEIFLSIYPKESIEYIIKEDEITNLQNYQINHHEFDIFNTLFLDNNVPPHFVTWDVKISLLDLSAAINWLYLTFWVSSLKV